MSGAYIHRPVLLDECIDALNIRPDGVYIDGTLGRGGHSEQIARRLTGGGRLICIDRDAQALEEGGARLAPGRTASPSFTETLEIWRNSSPTPGFPALTGCSLIWGFPLPSWTIPSVASPT